MQYKKHGTNFLVIPYDSVKDIFVQVNSVVLTGSDTQPMTVHHDHSCHVWVL